MWTLFRQQLFSPCTAPALFVSLGSEAEQAMNAASKDATAASELGFVPLDIEASNDMMLNHYENMGRLLLAVVTNHQVLPSAFAPYVLT
eukprot:COSAG01_NODE_67720_length_266_cov_0.622754_1_plen_88_part_11